MYINVNVQHTLLEPALTGTGMWRLEISESSFLKVWESGALGCGGPLPVCGSGSTFTLFEGWAVAGATEHFDSLAASCLTIHSGWDRFVGATAGGGRGGGDSSRAVGKGAVEALHQVSSETSPLKFSRAISSLGTPDQITQERDEMSISKPSNKTSWKHDLENPWRSFSVFVHPCMIPCKASTKW